MSKKSKTGDLPQGDVSSGVATAMEFSRQLDVLKIEKLQRRVEELREENDRMRLGRDKGEKDTHEFVAYIQREMEKKDDQIEGLKEELVAQQVAATEQRELATARWEERIAQLEERASTTEHGLRTRLGIAEDELAKLQGFREDKAELDKKLGEQREAIAALHEQSTADMAALERKFLEEKATARRQREIEIDDIRKAARDEARRGLNADTKKIVNDNRRMGEELRFQLQASDELQRDKDELLALRDRLRVEVALLQDKERTFAEEGHVQVQRIRHLDTKVKSLERSLSHVVRNFDKEQEQRTKKAGRELEEQTLDAAGLRALVKLKNKELRQVKGWAATILEQRGEVERFFLNALEEVKDEIRRRRSEEHTRAVLEYKAQLKQAGARQGGGGGGGGGGTSFPEIRSTRRAAESFPGSGAPAPLAPPTGVDLADLAPEDRERVLRLLFAKINGAQQAVEAAAPHTFDAGELEDRILGQPQSVSTTLIDGASTFGQ